MVLVLAALSTSFTSWFLPQASQYKLNRLGAVQYQLKMKIRVITVMTSVAVLLDATPSCGDKVTKPQHEDMIRHEQGLQGEKWVLVEELANQQQPKAKAHFMQPHHIEHGIYELGRQQVVARVAQQLLVAVMREQ
ncbi:hypothetical protein ON010_g11447 [Phytophthora cinnamomi]|nr:hypothetical protein ON010_g11447 [Phytophthora cinnamomi]